MPDDRLAELFSDLALAELGAPELDQVLARARQRRRRAWLGRSVPALAVLVAAGFGVSQVATFNGPMAAPATAPGSGQHHDLTGQSARVPAPMPTSKRYEESRLPPGHGQLLLGLSGARMFAMTRVGSAAAPITMPGLRALRGGRSLIVSGPVGGWVVTAATDPPTAQGPQATRLALVTAVGRRHQPFGPVFHRQVVVSIAVSPDGSRVAVSLIPAAGGDGAITVLPMPGHAGAPRTWRFPPDQASQADGLSWKPGGRYLSYVASRTATGRPGGGPQALDTAAPGSVAPGTTTWRQAGPRAPCTPDVTSWLGTSGQFGALEQCRGTATSHRQGEFFRTASASNGASTGPVIAVSRRTGCARPGLAPAPDGMSILISYCGLYLEADGKLTRLPGQFLTAAFAG